MTRWITVFALCSVLAGPLAMGQQASEAEVALKAAQQKALMDGDLNAAIEQYKQIVARHVANRAVASKALVEMGRAYEKLGNAEARNAYDRVAREFADQKEEAGEARMRLASLDRAPASDVLTVRRVLTIIGNGAPDLTSITADGRLGAGADWSTGDLVIRDMASGQLTRLLAGSLDPRSLGPAAAVGRYVAWPVISPDQRQVAFTRYGDPEIPSQGQLWVIANQPGSTPRLVTRNPEIRNAPPHAWSLDGKSVLVNIERVDGSWQIAWVSMDDGSVKVLKSFDWSERPDYRLRLSPDGRYIAYSARVREGSEESYVYLLTADGSAESVLIKTAAINESPAWTLDGQHIVFLSNVSGSFDLWALAVREGKAAGLPLVVKRDIGRIVNVGMTRSGSYFYTLRDIARDRLEYVSIAEMKAADERSAGSNSRIVGGFAGLNASWSPDGKHLAFIRRRAAGGGSYDVVVHSLETGEETPYSRSGILAAPPGWFHDGLGFLVLIQNQGKTRSLYRVDSKTGEFKEVLEFDPAVLAAGAFSLASDDKTLYVGGRNPGNNTMRLDRIVAVDMTTRQQRPLFSLPTGYQGYSVRLSPDGRTFALMIQQPNEWGMSLNAHLALADLDGSHYRIVYSDLSVALSGLAWTHDSRAILFGRREGSNTWQIVRFPATGGSQELSGVTLSDRPMAIDVIGNGSRLALSTIRNVGEYWAIDNLSSVLNAVR